MAAQQSSDPDHEDQARQLPTLLIAAGIVAIVAALVLIVLFLSHRTDKAAESASLSRTEVSELQNFLQERRAINAEQDARVQAQLDRQAYALCQVFSDFLARSRTPEGKQLLTQAYKQLDCPRVVKLDIPITPTPTLIPTPTKEDE